MKKIQALTVFQYFFAGLVYSFLYLPIVIFILYSFNKAAFPAPWEGFTFEWYYRLWYESDQLWRAFYNSLVVSLSATVLSLFMGLCIIFYVSQRKRIPSIMRLFYANLIVPEVVLAVGLLSVFTLFCIPLSRFTLIIAHTILGLGYVVPLLVTRYNEIDYRLTEASLDLGASTTQTFLKITFPLLSTSLIVSGLLVFIISFDDFVLSYFCVGASAQTLPLHILSMLRTGVSPVVSALSTGLLLMSSILVILFCSLTLKTRIIESGK